jgi:2-dehydro-3-deoxyphosphogluconate aldolase/(4S)-4-hydroxy-2-oxoglutarate aldolase
VTLNRDIEALQQVGVVAVLRGASAGIDAIVDDLAAGGLTTIEVTFSVPDAADVIARLSGRPELVIGAGTVTTPAQAEAAIAAGARFLVSPVSPPWLVPLSHEAGVLAVPGCATPTEIWAALAAGAHVVKVFPAARLGGPAYLRDLTAPLPGLRVMPSGGITVSDVADYRQAGAWCVGLGGELSRAAPGKERQEIAANAVRAAAL